MSLGMSLSNKGEPWYECKYENNELESEQFLCRSFLSMLGKRLSKFQFCAVGLGDLDSPSVLIAVF